MSTKNLSRTVIEGGRSGYYKAECDRYIREERAASRVYLKALAVHPSLHEDADLLAPIRRPSNPDFKDKTSPLYRFLDSRVGEDWNATRSELFERFDIRTTPGRHVLFDHLLRDVVVNSDPDSVERQRYLRYHVDAGGVLRKDRWDPWHGTRPAKPKRARNFNLETVARWLGHRKIGRCGPKNTFVLFVPARPARYEKEPRVKAIVDRWHGIVYAALDEAGNVIRRPEVSYPGTKYSSTTMVVLRSSARFRQARMLTKEESAYFLSLPESVREDILAQAPVNV